MIGEGIDSPNKLDQAKEAVQAATETVKVSPSPTPSKQAGNQVRLLTAWLAGLKKRPCTQLL